MKRERRHSDPRTMMAAARTRTHGGRQGGRCGGRMGSSDGVPHRLDVLRASPGGSTPPTASPVRAARDRLRGRGLAQSRPCAVVACPVAAAGLPCPRGDDADWRRAASPVRAATTSTGGGRPPLDADWPDGGSQWTLTGPTAVLPGRAACPGLLAATLWASAAAVASGIGTVSCGRRLAGRGLRGD